MEINLRFAIGNLQLKHKTRRHTPQAASHLQARLRVFVTSCLILLCTAAAPKAPQGFSIQKVSPDQTTFPMVACLDDNGRLFVTESSGLDLYKELQLQSRQCR